MSGSGDRGAAVADEMWGRLRRLAERLAALEQADAAGELDDDDRARLVGLRLRCARAADRARLADELADRVAEARARGRLSRSS
jgi:hypothetical protein